MEENQVPIQGQSEKPKKPIYKKWWFWAIIVLIIIIAAASGSKNDSQTASNPPDQQATSSSSNTSAPETKDTSIKPGMYKIGSDLTAGEYVIVGTSYFQLTKDSTGQLDSIICNDNFQNRTIITVKDGEYFTFKGGKAYPFSEAPKVDSSGATLPSGMYKVGTDLQPGEYKVKASGTGYVEVSSNSRHSMDSIISNDNFSGEKYVTVKSGQYIKIARAELVLK